MAEEDVCYEREEVPMKPNITPISWPILGGGTKCALSSGADILFAELLSSFLFLFPFGLRLFPFSIALC
jgi:hypothetical protein